MRKFLAVCLCLILLCSTFMGCAEGEQNESISSFSSSENSNMANPETSSFVSGSESDTDFEDKDESKTEQTTNTDVDDNEFIVLMPDKNSKEYFVKLDRPDAIFDVLVIGDTTLNSALRYLCTLADSENLQINLGYATCNETSTDVQLNSLNSGTAEYAYKYCEGIKMGNEEYFSLSDILKKAQWDYVILTQSPVNAGNASKYSGFNDFVAAVKTQIPNSAKIMWCIPWAYSDGCENEEFATYYSASHKEMLNAINNSTSEYPAKNANISKIINIAYLIETLNINGEYLTNGEQIMVGCGQYAVSLAILCTIAGITPDRITWSSPCTLTQFKSITAAIKAMK